MAVDPTQDYGGDAGVADNPVSMNAAPETPAADDQREISEARKNNVKRWLSLVKAAKKHWNTDFKRMRDDVYFSEGNHWENAIPGLEDDRIVVDITTRHLQLRTAALYAKNPTVVARRKEQIEFLAWDETPESAVKAQQTVQVGMSPEGQAAMQDDDIFAAEVGEAAALLDDIKQGMERRQAMDKLAKSLELVFRHQMERSNPPFKGQVKAMIPRSLTTGVGYVKLDYQRVTDRKPAQENRMSDMRDNLAELGRRLREWKDGDGDYDKTRAEFDELQVQLNNMAAQKPVVLKEGLLFQFPASWSIIPDKKCTNLVGFAGSDWVAEEIDMSPEDVLETFDVKLTNYTKYQKQNDGQIVEAHGSSEEAQHIAAVYCIYNRRTGMVYWVCDGYEDFLKEPAAPEIYFPAFFPWFAYVPNRAESVKSPFPRSDVRLMMPMQRELNRNAEALRQHRIANQPKYVHDATGFEDDEVISIMDMPVHSSTPIKAIAEGKKIEDMIAVIPKTEIDPMMYSADVIFDSLTRVVGAQEANFGQPAKSGDRTTATSASISESSRLSSQQSNADDLDDLLSLVAYNGGIVLLTQMGVEQAKRIAGKGAVWVSLSREEACEQLYLEIIAGSSGRPNQAQEVSIAKEVMPLLMQIPGMSPLKCAEWLIRIMDGRIRPSELMDPAITQSIMSMNRGAQPVGDTANDPGQQGAEGANNAPKDSKGTDGQGGVPATPQPAVAA